MAAFDSLDKASGASNTGHSRKRKNEKSDEDKYVALDCEMVQTIASHSALARCTIVDRVGDVVYDSYVRPNESIVDFRTQYSGVHPHHMKTAKAFFVAQNEIKEVIRGKYVVGHTVHRDFESIGIEHPEDKIIDVTQLPILRKALGLGAGSKPTVSLQRMTKALLCEDIQTGAHSSLEDAWATMRLFLLSLEPSKIPANVVLPPGRHRNRPFKWVAKTSNDRRTTTSNNG